MFCRTFVQDISEVEGKKMLKLWQDAVELPVHCNINKGKEKSGFRGFSCIKAC